MILLVDMDAFFASVEQAHHPHLRGRPVIVCGDPHRRGVVTAASYEARPSGVHAGMALSEARRLCPEAEYVEGNPEKYVGISLQLLTLYLEWTPDVEPFSVDEAFIGLDPRITTLAQATETAAEIQREIDRRFSLGASIGIGPNKLVAKMASGVAKLRGLTAFDEPAFQRHFWERDIQDLWGVGPKLGERMRSLGLLTIGDLARSPLAVLKGEFGIIGPQLQAAAHGRDDTPIHPYHQGVEPKSMGHEVTLPRDCSDAAYLEGTLLRLADQVGRRLRSERYCGRVVTLKLRNSRFETVTRQRALATHTAECPEIFEVARTLFRENWQGERWGCSASASRRSSASRSAAGGLFTARAGSGCGRRWTGRDRLGEASLVPAGSLTASANSGTCRSAR